MAAISRATETAGTRSSDSRVRDAAIAGARTGYEHAVLPLQARPTRSVMFPGGWMSRQPRRAVTTGRRLGTWGTVGVASGGEGTPAGLHASCAGPCFHASPATVTTAGTAGALIRDLHALRAER